MRVKKQCKKGKGGEGDEIEVAMAKIHSEWFYKVLYRANTFTGFSST